MNQLSDHPPTLIREAIRDLEIQEKDPEVTINMGVWLHRINNHQETCESCLAGAVMISSLGATKRGSRLTPSNFTIDAMNKLEALNSFRVGAVACAMYFLGIPWDFQSIVIPNYEKSPKKFKAAMLAMADAIEVELAKQL